MTNNYAFVCRYASLYFIACVDPDDNELIILEQIHLFVEVLDRYFGNVRRRLIDVSA
jgi:AP-1 complex subunit sigma 1/2